MAVQRAPHSPSPEIVIITQPLPLEIVALLVVAKDESKCLCLNDGSDTSNIDLKIMSWAQGHNKPGAYLLFADES